MTDTLRRAREAIDQSIAALDAGRLDSAGWLRVTALLSPAVTATRLAQAMAEREVVRELPRPSRRWRKSGT